MVVRLRMVLWRVVLALLRLVVVEAVRRDTHRFGSMSLLVVVVVGIVSSLVVVVSSIVVLSRHRVVVVVERASAARHADRVFRRRPSLLACLSRRGHRCRCALVFIVVSSVVVVVRHRVKASSSSSCRASSGSVVARPSGVAVRCAST